MKRDWWHALGSLPWAAFPLSRSARFFEAGEVRLAILSLLAEGPRNGYQLIKELQERSGGVYRASAGSVYPTLQQLEYQRLVELRPREGRRLYAITEAGRAELKRDPHAVRRIWERAERWEDWGRQLSPCAIVLLEPAIAVVRAAVRAGTRAGGKHEEAHRIIAILDRARKELEDIAPAAAGASATEAGASATEKVSEEKPKSRDTDEAWFL